jgi:peptide/nickel transport system permease protein
MRFVVKRILAGLVTVVALSVVVFFLPRAMGDPVNILVPTDATQETRDELKAHLGLDEPLIVQYGIFVKNALKGDLGKSVFLKQPVTDLIRERFPNTLKLALATSVIFIPLGIMLGVMCAIKRNRFPDILGRFIAVLGQSMPDFWVGIMLVMVFSVTLKLLPTSGMGGPDHYVMPTITMGWVLLSGIARLSRSSMLEVLGSDYIRFLRARGFSELSVVAKHALRNAAIPVVTMSAIMFAYSLTGSVIVESVFAWPGLGRLAWESVVRADFPLIVGIALFYGVIFIAVNLLADLLYSRLDPRVALS